MSKLGDRLGSKLGPNARSILEAGREGDNPTRDDRARVKRALMRTLAAGAAVGATSAAASSAGAAAPLAAKGTSIGLGIKLFGAVVLVLAAASGVVLQRASSPDRDRDRDRDRAVAPLAASATAVFAADTANAAPTKMDGAIVAPAQVAAAARASDPAGLEKPRAAAAAASSSPRIVARVPVAIDDAEAISPPPAAAPQPGIAGEDPLAAETRRLREAHGALQAGDPQKALGLLGEQGGQLDEERAAERVIALCQLGRVAEAEVARAAFLREHPSSPLAGRVRGGCAPSNSK